MKLVLEIPEWAEKRNLYIYSGTELIAVRRVLYQGLDKVALKTVRCNYCGACCKNLKQKGHLYPVVGKDSRCVHLKKGAIIPERIDRGPKPEQEYSCAIARDMPRSCTQHPQNPSELDYCCIEEVEIDAFV